MGQGKLVMAAMSGGVDSSVTACLLQEQGWDVAGVNLKLYDESRGTDARAVCRQHDIPFYVMDYREAFKRDVIDDFTREYEHGRTPNPCIRCNHLIKFGGLLEKARSMNAQYVATGHYARIEHDKKSGRYRLLKGTDPDKDQSYFLYRLTQDQLDHTLFPVGGCTKEEVRELARERDLPVSAKPGSQEICFIPNDDYKAFLEKARPDLNRPGNIVDRAGTVRGIHQGISRYTIGQRKGLGISHPTPLYVVDLDPATNTVLVGEDIDLLSSGLRADRMNWIATEGISGPITVQARIRYRHRAVDATVIPDGKDGVSVTFTEPQRAITPGQAVVFYDGEVVMGGGVISKRTGNL